MDIIYLLLGFSLLLAIIFLAAFIFSIRSGQFDDTFSPGVRILFDDIEKKKTDPDVKPGEEIKARKEINKIKEKQDRD